MKRLEDQIISGVELAKLLNMTDRNVRLLAEDGIFNKKNRGKYSLIESVNAYVEYLKSKRLTTEEEDSGVLDNVAEDAKLKKVRREKVEIENAILKADLHKSEDVKFIMDDMLMNFKTKLTSLPNKLAPILVDFTDKTEVKKCLQGEINDALGELSEYDPKKFSTDYIDKVVDQEI